MTSSAQFALILLQEARKTAAPQGASSPGFSVTLDIASLIWALVVLVVCLAYRAKLPALLRGLLGRATKLEFAGFSIELAKATAFSPDWAAGALDLRHQAVAIEVNDSTAANFRAQLMQEGRVDYAEVNLGGGQEWLSSRLFIMSIVFARMKGIRALAFVETATDTRRRYVGWAEPHRVRWALAMRFPWLEQAYSRAYSQIVGAPAPTTFVVDDVGRLGQQFITHDPGPSLSLIQGFLGQIQVAMAPPALPTPDTEWILIDPATNTREHASWLTSSDLEGILRASLNLSYVRGTELRAKSGKERLKILFDFEGAFVAVVNDDRRLEYLVDRNVLLNQVIQHLPGADSGNDS